MAQFLISSDGVRLTLQLPQSPDELAEVKRTLIQVINWIDELSGGKNE